MRSVCPFARTSLFARNTIKRILVRTEHGNRPLQQRQLAAVFVNHGFGFSSPFFFNAFCVWFILYFVVVYIFFCFAAVVVVADLESP